MGLAFQLRQVAHTTPCTTVRDTKLVKLFYGIEVANSSPNASMGVGEMCLKYFQCIFND